MRGSATTRAGLVEREAELAALVDAVELAGSGSGSLVAIEGPAGVGKSLLLERAAEHAGDARLRVLRARASQLERDMPFGVVRHLFGQALRGAHDREPLLAGGAALAEPILAEHPEAVAHSPSPDAGPALAHAVYWLAANLAERSPLLIAVDDLHWADAPSLRCLGLLASRVRELPVVLAVAIRTGEDAAAPQALADVISVPGAALLTPRPLTADGVGAVIAATLGDADRDFTRACHQSVAGNPFLLSQLIVELQRTRIAPRADQVAAVRDTGPRSVSRSMLARLATLPGGAVQLASAVAVLGDGCEPRHAAGLAGLSDDEAAGVADALSRISVLRRDMRLAFVHPIVRQAVYEDVGVHARARRHAEAARLLAADDAASDHVAAHLLLAPRQGDGWAVERLREAATTALARGEPGTAARYLGRALDEPPHADDRAAVLRELGSTELLAAQPAGVAHMTNARELTADVAERAAIALDLARALLPIGQFDAIERLLGQSIAETAGADPELTLLLETELVSALQNVPRGVERLAHFEGRASGLRGETPAERYALALLASLRVRRGEPAVASTRLATLALGDGRLLTDLGPGAAGAMYALGALIWAESYDVAENAAREMLDLSGRDGSVFRSGVATFALSVAAFRQGDMRRAEEYARDSVRAFQAAGWPAALGMGLMALVDALIERGALDEAQAELSRSGCDGDLPEVITFTWLLASRGRLRLAHGDADGALSDLLAAGERNTAIGTANPAVSPWREDAIIAHLRTGRLDDATALADQHVTLASTFGSPRALGIALRTRGLCQPSDQGTGDLRRAVEVLAGSQAPVEHARALTDLGAALRRANRRAEARPLLAEALDLATRCGATLLASRATDELRATGARPRRALLTGVDSLTTSERRICRLAADGLTNREIAQTLFVTLKTVETHLSHGYTKLGISSRGQLAHALSQPARGGMLDNGQ